ncbi:hypothetical protein ACP70R_031118 [Stipagrostis hirtigluma subsp. patula]
MGDAAAGRGHVVSPPRSVEEIYKDYRARRSAILRALTHDVEDFYAQCDPDKENLCLYGYANEAWEVALPAEEVPTELPEPALGINFARDGMNRRDWLALVAVHSDSWLLAVAFYYAARLNRNDSDVVSGVRQSKERSNMDNGSRAKPSIKIENNGRTNDEAYGEEDSDHGETLCGTCGGIYSADEFWIGCDICERWYHGKCVKITPARAESIKHYKCPSCSSKRARQ